MTTLLPPAQLQFLDANGNPYAGGSLFTYVPNTTTPKQTWQDAGQTVLNTNPIILDAAGRCTVYGSGTYRTQLFDGLGNLVWDKPSASTDAFVSAAMLPVVAAASTDAATALLTYLAPGVGAVSRTIANRFTDIVSVLDYGAKGDGITNDYAAIQAACNAQSAGGGGIVFLPATGNRYLINTGLGLANGVILMGEGKLFSGLTATPAQWAAAGTWIQCTDLTNAAVTLVGHGSGIVGVNFVYAQTVPSAGAYVPIAFPYTISIQNTFASIDNVIIIGAYQGISVNLTSGSGGGTYGRITNCMISAMRVGLQIVNVNDTMQFQNIWIENEWYALDATVVTYLQTNLVGIECRYCDNCNFQDIQIYQARYGMTLTDSTCLGNTHSMFNGTMTNIDFNLCVTAISVAATTTTFVAQMQNILFQYAPGTAGPAFNLNSDNVDLQISNLRIAAASAAAILLGNGTGGRMQINGFICTSYSAVTIGQPCINVGTNAQLSLGLSLITRISGNGPMLLGTFIHTSQAGFWKPFAAAASFTGTGALIAISTSAYFDPVNAGALQIRLRGQILITTPQAAGTITLALSGYAAATITGIVASVATTVNFDSGFIDFVVGAGATLGQLQWNATSGVIADLSTVTVEWR